MKPFLVLSFSLAFLLLLSFFVRFWFRQWAIGRERRLGEKKRKNGRMQHKVKANATVTSFGPSLSLSLFPRFPNQFHLQ